MKRVLIHSNACWLNTGYGSQCAQIATRLTAAGYDVAVSAFAGIQGTVTNFNGIPVLPGGIEAYGNDVLAGHAKSFSADLVLTLMDAWVLNPEMAKSLNMACWMPVDCTPLSAMDRGFLRGSKVTPIAMSEFGLKEFADAGFAALYAPHGIETQTYAPQDKAEARKALGVPQGAYVIGINAANLDAVRKGFPEAFAAFAMFRKKHPEAILLLHSHQTGPGTGCDLGDIVARLDIGDAVRWSNPYQYTCGGYSAQDMARWYATLDLYSGCTYAEGFGLPLLEAASCGIPAVATDFSAMPQVAGPLAGLVSGDPFWNPRHRSFWSKPRVGEIAAAYEAAFAAAPVDPDLLRKHALQYDADLVFAEHWLPVLTELGGRL